MTKRARLRRGARAATGPRRSNHARSPPLAYARVIMQSCCRQQYSILRPFGTNHRTLMPPSTSPAHPPASISSTCAQWHTYHQSRPHHGAIHAIQVRICSRGNDSSYPMCLLYPHYVPVCSLGTYAGLSCARSACMLWSISQGTTGSRTGGCHACVCPTKEGRVPACLVVSGAKPPTGPYAHTYV